MIANTPPMGWNSWDCYGAAVTEEIVRKNAEYMAEHLKPFGWEYIVVDIQWSSPDATGHAYQPFSDLEMDEYGRLIPAVNRFPSAADGKGFRPLADYIHSLGLKFGIHIMRGMPRMAAHRRMPIEGSSACGIRICTVSGVNCRRQQLIMTASSVFTPPGEWTSLSATISHASIRTADGKLS